MRCPIRYPLLVTIPLAGAGGVLGLRLVDATLGPQPLDMLTALGFVILIGVVVKAIAAVASDTPTEGLATVELRSKRAAAEGDDSRSAAASEGHDRAAVQRVIRRHMSAVRACYERELRK